MNFKYRVYHSEDAKSALDKWCNPLSGEDVLGEYRQFSSVLAVMWSEAAIVASCEACVPESDGINVELQTDRSETDADSALARFLVRVNSQIPRLCLVVEKLTL